MFAIRKELRHFQRTLPPSSCPFITGKCASHEVHLPEQAQAARGLYGLLGAAMGR